MYHFNNSRRVVGGAMIQSRFVFSMAGIRRSRHAADCRLLKY